MAETDLDAAGIEVTHGRAGRERGLRSHFPSSHGDGAKADGGAARDDDRWHVDTPEGLTASKEATTFRLLSDGPVDASTVASLPRVVQTALQRAKELLQVHVRRLQPVDGDAPTGTDGGANAADEFPARGLAADGTAQRKDRDSTGAGAGTSLPRQSSFFAALRDQSQHWSSWNLRALASPVHTALCGRTAPVGTRLSPDADDDDAEPRTAGDGWWSMQKYVWWSW